jgi:cellulose synthase/poly-beta-1,6-N-acetylglucosamine synthase-like glycosyltransferase
MAGGGLEGRQAVTGSATTAEDATYAERARRLGLRFSPSVAPGRARTVLPDPQAVIAGTFAMPAGGLGPAYFAPTAESLDTIAGWLAAYPSAKARLIVSTPTAIRDALMEAGRAAYLATAVNRLRTYRPDLSASRVLAPRQTLALALSAALVAAALWLNLPLTLLFVSVLGGAVFFGVTVLRFIAARNVVTERHRLPPPKIRDHDLPTYTVLAPLYREGAVVADLIAALRRLDWPAEKLDIKLLVEEDDTETRAFATRLCPGPPFEVVVIPRGGPRTKPKALSYALPFARGAFVTIYDAEDRPHPRQLREAYGVFAASDRRLACLQAPIVIDNPRASFLARLFAIEYSALFDGLLPALAAMDMPLPLGGTSNHFRRAALERVHGWDPYNVTEDADLGARLARFGYRSETISLPTFEDAPVALMPWLRQRTRWFKGWMQTWLVHTRHPLVTLREMGAKQFIGFALVGIGMIASVIIHPFYLATLVLVATNPLQLWGDGGITAAAVAGLSIFNLVTGYLAMAMLAGRTLALRNRSAEASGLIWLPFYWLLMSVAGYRAIAQLVLRPFHWDKTPHTPRRASTPARAASPAAHGGVSARRG